MLRFVDAVEEVEEIAGMFNDRGDRRKKMYKARCDPFALYSEDEFRRKYRFSKEGAKYVVGKYASCLVSDINRGGKLTPELQILTALRYWGRNEVSCF